MLAETAQACAGAEARKKTQGLLERWQTSDGARQGVLEAGEGSHDKHNRNQIVIKPFQSSHPSRFF